MIRFPLCFHPAMAVTNTFKQSYRLIAAHLGAKPLLSDDLAGASIAEVRCPKEEAKLRSHQAHAALYALVAEVRPPLALCRAEAVHGEDKAVHGWKGNGETLAS